MFCRRKSLCVFSLTTIFLLLLYLSTDSPEVGNGVVPFRQSSHHILSHGSMYGEKSESRSQRITEFLLGKREKSENEIRAGLDSSESSDRDYGLYRQYDYEIEARELDEEDEEETQSRLSDSKPNNTVSPGTHHLPGALIIGAKKAGTRALLEFLRLHPSVKAAKQEIHFFDRYFHRGVGWYRRNLPPRNKGELTMEKTPAYLVSPQVPGRVRDLLPDVKLLIVVREPATRALSDYAQSVSKHTPRKNFTQLVFADHTTGLVNVNWGPVVSGLYTRHLQRWLHYFPISSFHVVDGENLVVNPAEEMKEVEKFLKLKPFISPHHFYFNKTKGFSCIVKKENATAATSGNSENKTSQHPMDSQKNLSDDPKNLPDSSSNLPDNPKNLLEDRKNFPASQKSLPPKEEHVMFMNMSLPVSRIHCLGSTKGREHPDVDPETLKMLREFFRPFNEKFFRIIGRRFDWNR